MKKLDLNKPVQTRDGKPARIISTDAKHKKFPVVALISTDEGEEPCGFTLDGQFYSSGKESESDLINVPPPKKVFERWINVFYDGSALMYTNPLAASTTRGPVGTTIHVKTEYVEGEHQLDL